MIARQIECLLCSIYHSNSRHPCTGKCTKMATVAIVNASMHMLYWLMSLGTNSVVTKCNTHLH